MEGARVTVVEVTVPGVLPVADLRYESHGGTAWGDELQDLRVVAFMFSRPVHREDRVGYVPTQVVADHIRSMGYLGVAYGSAVRPGGFNVAIFDPSIAGIADPRLYEVESVEFRCADLGSGTTYEAALRDHTQDKSLDIPGNRR